MFSSDMTISEVAYEYTRRLQVPGLRVVPYPNVNGNKLIIQAQEGIGSEVAKNFLSSNNVRINPDIINKNHIALDKNADGSFNGIVV